MTTLDDSSVRPGPGRLAARGLLSLAAVVPIAYWLLIAFFLLILRCDEGCSGEQAAHWRYPVQFALAVCGALPALAALWLGFTRHRRAYRLLLVVGVVGAVAWVTWVVGFGEF